MYHVAMENGETTLIIILILLIQLIVVFLDNHININIFFSNINSKKIASAYTRRSKFLYITRSIFFLIPPLLGFCLSFFNKYEFLLIFFSAIFITFFVSLIQFYFFVNKNFGFKFISRTFSFKFIFRINFFIGIFAFSLHLISPFILNYIALIFPESALWVVQLNPIISSLATTYVVFFLDPKISKIIDHKSDLFEVIYESILTRLLGRLVIVLIFVLIYIL